MAWTQTDYAQYLDRRKKPDACATTGVTEELPLHAKIIAHCNAQWPRWKYLHANPAAKSTIQKGAQDFTIFLPHSRTVCIEVKTLTGKQSPEQLQWAAEMKILGHEVYVIRGFDEFLAVMATVLGSQRECRQVQSKPQSEADRC